MYIYIYICIYIYIHIYTIHMSLLCDTFLSRFRSSNLCVTIVCELIRLSWSGSSKLYVTCCVCCSVLQCIEVCCSALHIVNPRYQVVCHKMYVTCCGSHIVCHCADMSNQVDRPTNMTLTYVQNIYIRVRVRVYTYVRVRIYTYVRVFVCV